MSTVRAPTRNRLNLSGVSWESYSLISRALDGRHLRVTYDRGELEIATLSSPHERYKHLLRCLVCLLVEGLNWDMACFGSMTCKRKAKRRAIEPDECFWIQNEPSVRCKDDIDLRRDPPPDLILEIDYTRSLLNRLGILAALRVPEVWCYDGITLRIRVLGEDGRYTQTNQSRAFPFLPMAEVERFLNLRSTMSETDLLLQWRAWVRDRIAVGWA